MFMNCLNLKKLDLRNFEINKVEKMVNFLANCNAEVLVNKEFYEKCDEKTKTKLKIN